MIRLTLDIVLMNEDKVNEGELVKKMTAEKTTKQVAAYVEAVVIPEITNVARTKTVGASAHVHRRGDVQCLSLYESRDHEPIHEYSDA